MKDRASHGRIALPGSHGRFLVRAAIGFVAVLGLRALVPGLDRWAIRSTIASLDALLRAAHAAPSIAGDTITTGAVAFRVVSDCTPLMPTLMIVVAILAFPASWRSRVAGILVAALLLWAHNLFRIVVLVGVISRWPWAFEFVHVYLWQTVTLVVVVGTFMAWLHACDRLARERPRHHAGPAGPAA